MASIITTTRLVTIQEWLGLRAPWRLALYAAMGLLPVLLLAPFANAPFTRDEGVYAVVAMGILDGELPYRDVFDHKPPFVHVWYALSFALFGESVVAPRVLAMLFFVGSTFTVFAITARAVGRTAAYVAGFSMGATAGIVTIGAVANAEVFTVFPALVSLYAALRGVQARRVRSGSWRWFLLSGLLAGVAVMTKQVALLQTAAIGVVILGSSSSRVRDLSAFVGGGAIVLVGVLLPFALSGGWADFWYANLTYNRLYLVADGPGPLTSLARFLVVAIPYWSFAALGVFVLVRGQHRVGVWLLGLWCVASAGSVFVTGRMYDHYWVMSLPALSLLVGFAASSHFWTASERSSHVPRLALTGLALFLAMTSVALNARPFLESDAEARHVAQYGQSGLRQAAAQTVSDRVSGLLGPGDTFYELGQETAVYFGAGSLPSTRFVSDRQFYLDPETLDEALSDLRAEPPAILLLTRPVEDIPPDGRTEAAVLIRDRWVPLPFAHLITHQYEFVEREAFADVYRLAARPAR